MFTIKCYRLHPAALISEAFNDPEHFCNVFMIDQAKKAFHYLLDDYGFTGAITYAKPIKLRSFEPKWNSSNNYHLFIDHTQLSMCKASTISFYCFVRTTITVCSKSICRDARVEHHDVTGANGTKDFFCINTHTHTKQHLGNNQQINKHPLQRYPSFRPPDRSVNFLITYPGGPI